MSKGKLITSDEVRLHNHRGSVWIVIQNEVYDVTSFLQEHPGGEDPLLESSGKDATIAFNDVGHSKDAVAMLKKFRVGKLAPGTGGALPKMKGQLWRSRPSNPCSSNPSHGEKSWHSFEGVEPGPRQKSPKSKYKSPRRPCAQRRVQTVVVPRDNRRGAPSCRPEPRPSSSPLKWAVLALAAALILGLAYKKFAA